MGYMTGKEYKSKSFTDYIHSLSDIVGAMCANGMVITDMQEFQYDISDGFEYLNNKGFALSILIEGRKSE